MKRIILLVFSGLLSLYSNAQGSSWSAVAKSGLCGQLINYIPATNVTIPVNFIFFQPLSGTGKFDTVTQASCLDIINFMNTKWSSLSPVGKPLPPPYTAPAGYTDTKIRFAFKSISFKRDAQYNAKSTASGDTVYPAYTVTDSSALNLVFNVSPYFGPVGKGSLNDGVEGSNLVRLLQTSTGWGFENTGVKHLYFLHEVGHALGLPHTHPNLKDIKPTNPNGTILPPAPIDDFWYEDSAQVSHLPWNNFMGETWSARDYLSPKQIGFMHYMLKADPVVSKMAAGNSCVTGADWAMNSGTYPGPIYADADLIIPQGQDVILTGCVYMKTGTKIIVEPGGKLSIINGLITRACNMPWKGIEVQANPGAIQYIDPVTQMPGSSAGMLFLDHASIQDAEIAVNLGKYNSYGTYYVEAGVAGFSGSYISGTGGGIVRSKNSSFYNNRISVNFNPYYVLASNGGNISSFKEDVFNFDGDYMNPNPTFCAVNINSAYGIQILGCRFYDMIKKNAIGVRCLNGSVIIKDASNQTTFRGFKYGVYLSNWLTNVPVAPTQIRNVKIDQAVGGGGCRGGIFALGTFGTEITGCRIDISQPATYSGQLTYGIYLDGCDGYVVENNDLRGGANAYMTGGIFVNNSGPGANSIYNNVLQNHQQGIWAQNINYDVAGTTGLKINCDDFTNVRYNIGVQSAYMGPVCLGCPPPYQPAGVAVTQGVAFTPDEKDNVRNTYHTQNACTAENKYYIDTHNNFVISSHGSFLGNQYHPTPQPSCSNNTELVDIVGLFTSNPKTFWCPANYYQSFNTNALSGNISAQRANIANLNAEFSSKLDKGNTSRLLALLQGPYGPGVVLDSLLAADFLSDTVLQAFFGRTSLAPDHLKAVFDKNAPVHPKVWAQLAELGLSASLFSQMDSIQFRSNRLSTREVLRSQLNLAGNEFGLLSNEKIRRFLSDSTGGAYDSIAAIYQRNELPNSAFKLVDLSIATGHYTEASALINSLNTDPANEDICGLFHHMLALRRDSSYYESMQADSNIHHYFKNCVGSHRPLLDAYAKGLLEYVYQERTEEITLQPAGVDPDWESEVRKAKTAQVQQLSSLNNKNIRIYPNPASNQLSIENEDTKAVLQVVITDLSGKTVLQQECTQSCLLALDTLYNGIYLVHLYQEGTFLSAQKLVIIK